MVTGEGDCKRRAEQGETVCELCQGGLCSRGHETAEFPDFLSFFCSLDLVAAFGNGWTPSLAVVDLVVVEEAAAVEEEEVVPEDRATIAAKKVTFPTPARTRATTMEEAAAVSAAVEDPEAEDADVVRRG